MFRRIVESGQDKEFDTREQAERYAAEARAPASPRYRGLLRTLESLNASGKYLDMGAGPGMAAVLVARRFPDIHITAVEPSPAMVSVGKEIIGEQRLSDRIRYVEGSVDDTEFLGGLGKFDIVYSSFTLHHFADPKRALHTLLALVAGGGTLVVYDLRRVLWLYPVRIRNGFFMSIRASYRPIEIRGMMAELGVERYELKAFFPYFLQVLTVPAHR